MNRVFSFALMGIAFFLCFQPGIRGEKKDGIKNETILIIRHAEKPESGKHLSPEGVKRSQAYVRYFQTLRIDSRSVKIDHLFAADESAHSDRSRETITPLSDALGLKIHDKFEEDDVKDLSKKLQGGAYNGETVLICWHHGKIPDLLKALGVHPKEVLPGGVWPEEAFGWLVVLRYDQKGQVSTHVYNEGLAPGDAKHLPPVK